MRPSALFVLISALLLASCGGGGQQSESDYRSDLNTACLELAVDTGKIAPTVKQQALDLSQARALAAQAGDRFRESVDELDPSDSLEDPHQELLDAGNEASQSTQSASAANVRALAQRLLGIYTKLGATDCVRVQREALARIPAK